MKGMAFKKLDKIEKEGEMNRKVGSLVLTVLLIGLVALPGCASKAELDECKALVAEQSVTIEEKAAQIQSQNTTIKEKTAQIEALETKIVELEVELESERAEVLGDWSYDDPSYAELVAFYVEDNTEQLESNHPAAAQMFLRNAKVKGIRGYSVTILIEEDEIWYFTGFETTDRGWVYFLPAMDQEVKLEVGKKYHELNGFLPFGVDDTIVEIYISGG